MKEFNQRLNEIAKHYNLTSYADFAKKAGISHQNASNYLKGERVPNAEALKRIIQKFEGLNAEWLLTGEGSMITHGMLKEAMKILGINRTRFYKLLEDPNCKIKKSKILNRYSLDSIYREVERLVG